MTDSHKHVIGLTAFIAVAGVSLLVTAVASDHWVNSKLKGDETGNRTEYAELSFGLFNGEGEYDVGLSPRPVRLELKCDLSESVCGYINTKKDNAESIFENQVKLFKNGTGDVESYALFDFALFVSTLVMLCLAMVFGLLAIGFAIFNVFGRPIESITGVAGLYAWNAISLIFVLTGMGVYIGLFYTQLTDMVPHMEMLVVDGTVWKNSTELQWSFFCVAGAAGAFLLNIFFLLVSGKKCACSYSKSGEKEVDNGIILY